MTPRIRPSPQARRSAQVEVALALLGAAVAEGEQAAEAAIGGAVGRPGDDVGRPVAEDEAAADGIGEASRLRRAMAADDAGERVAVGDGDAGEAEPGGLGDQLLRMRAAAQEGEIGGDGELGEGGHAKTPCRYQRGAAVSRP